MLPIKQYTREVLNLAVTRREKHLFAYRDTYHRFFGILFSVIEMCGDHNLRVFRAQYYPRQRVLRIGLSWDRSEDYLRSSGYFSLWQGGIFNSSGDIEMWPKVKCNIDNWVQIANQSDQDVIEKIVSCAGLPWGDRFALPEHSGAFKHDIRHLLQSISTLQAVTPVRHQLVVDNLVEQIKFFAQQAEGDFG